MIWISKVTDLNRRRLPTKQFELGSFSVPVPVLSNTRQSSRRNRNVKARITKRSRYLMWVFDIDAEAQFFQQTSLGFDHFVFAIDVNLIDQQWTNETEIESTLRNVWWAVRCISLPSRSNLLDMMKYVDHIARTSSIFFDFRGEIRTRHGDDFHRSTNKRRGIEITMK